MNQLRSLAWKLNWFRQSELEGSLLLGRMVRIASDTWLVEQLTKHCAEEAEHSRIWVEVLSQLQLPAIRILRSYQSFYLEKSGYPRSLLDVLAFTQIFERRVHQTFLAELKRPETLSAAREAFRRMIDDEKGHLCWVAQWLRTQSDSEERLRHFERVDQLVFAELRPFEECLWDIPNLGVE